jgi:nitrogen fixation protein
LSIKNDTSYEGTEDLTVELSNPTGNATLGSPKAVPITIVDDPAGTFQFNSSSYTVDAATGSITLKVMRTGGSEGVSTVDYTTSDGTAIAGVNYRATNGTLVFNHGVTDRTIQVPILDPEATGSDTRFYVTLSDPNGGASIGTPKKATVTINANDGAGEGSFTINLKKGWNLISIPVVPRDGNITTLFSPIMGNISIIWEYNSSNGTNAWAYYTTMTDKYEQGTLRSVNERQGYWVRCTNDTAFTVTGYRPQSSNVTLKSGWNLIGNPTLDIRQPLAAYPAEKIVWQFNSSNASSPWSYHTTVTDKYKQGTLTELKPGYGYWVRIP